MDVANVLLFEVRGHLGIISLNTPKNLNSLSLDMIHQMNCQLAVWEDDPRIQAILLESTSPKAFCAGGDVVALYRDMKEGKFFQAGDFFKYEYELDQYIHHFKKPIVCLAQGIVMGGGIGIMNGCGYRVVCETTKLAMPEISIGLFPDVGGSFFLNRMPGRVGLYLGLTGTRFDGGDALYTKMADHFVPREAFTTLKEELCNLLNGIGGVGEAHRRITNVVRQFATSAEDFGLSSQVAAHFDEIQELTDVSSIEDFHRKASLKAKASQSSNDDKWLARGLQTFLSGSPTSAALIFEQLKRGRGMALEQVFEQELNMARQCTIHHDFPEGVRALLIEKDGNPRWSPAKLEDVGRELVEEHFKAPTTPKEDL